MRYAIPAVLISLTLATSAIAQSGGAGGSSSGGGASTGGSSTSSSTTPGATGTSGTTTGVTPRSGSANNDAPITINEQMRANSGSNLNSPAPATSVAPGTTVGQAGSGTVNARKCSTPDCSSPLSGRYMAIVDSMVRIAGVPTARRHSR
jgi:hypothetical protein